MTRYEDLQAEIRRRKRDRWLEILATEPAERPVGRRPRDPAQERLLLRLDRARIARRDAAGAVHVVSARAPSTDADEPSG